MLRVFGKDWGSLYTLYKIKSFWTWRRRIHNWEQRFQLFSLRSKKSISRYSFSAQVLYQVAWSILPILILSLVGFFILEKLDKPIILLFKYLANYLRFDLSNFQGKPDNNYIVSFVGTISQVAGIFLGLYYTAIGVVVSTAYAKFPQQLRLLLLRERIGNLYILLTTVLATFALLTLTLRGVGYETGRLSYAAICLLSLFSIISFVRFGLHVFNLFDLTSILTEPFQNLTNAIRRVAVITRGNLGSIHEISRLEAQQALQIFEDVISVSASNKFDQERIAQSVLGCLLKGLTEYAENKGKIATESRWFPTAQHHRSWLTADASYIATSLNTGTPLFPMQVTDINWFENRVFSLIERSLNILLRTENGATYIRSFSTLSNVVGNLIEKHAVDEAVKLITCINSVVQKFVRNHSRLASAKPIDSLPPHLAQLASMHSLLYIELIISFGKSVRSLGAHELGKIAERIFESPRSSVACNKALPRRVLDEFHRLTKLVKFETQVEGVPVTQKWYLRQLLGLATARHIESAINTVYQILSDYCKQDAKGAATTALAEFECYRMVGAIEGLEKFSFHLRFARSVYEEIKESRRAIDIPFPDIDFGKIDKDGKQLRGRLLNSLVAYSLHQGYTERPPETPDFFGQAYFFCLEECLAFLREGDEKRFKQLFPITFAMALTAYNAVEKELKSHPHETRIIFMTESLEDIMCLSGLAYIYSELNSKAFYTTVEEVWNNHLNSLTDRSSFIKFLLLTIRMRKGTFSLKPRDILRGGWDQHLSNEFRERGLMEEDFSFHRSKDEMEKKRHSSKLIQVLGRYSLAINNTIETFVCLYLLKQPESAHVELPPSVNSFKDTLERAANED